MKEQILARTIEYLLEFGVSGLSLRPLAKKIGTSDRMILYYFKSKDLLVQEAVEQLAEMMVSQIHQRCEASDLKSPGDFVACVWDAFVDLGSRPLAVLFLELDLMSLRDPSAFGEIGKFLMGEWSKVVKTNLTLLVGEKKKDVQAIEALSAELLGAIIHHLVSQGNSPKGTLKRLQARADCLRT